MEDSIKQETGTTPEIENAEGNNPSVSVTEVETISDTDLSSMSADDIDKFVSKMDLNEQAGSSKQNTNDVQDNTPVTEDNSEQSNDNDNDSSYDLEVNGSKIKINSKEELIQLAQDGAEANYQESTKSSNAISQKIAKAFESAEINDLSEENINVLIDIAKGNKGALKHFIKANNINLGEDMSSSIDDFDSSDGFDSSDEMEQVDKLEEEYKPEDYVNKGSQEEFEKVLAMVSVPEKAESFKVLENFIQSNSKDSNFINNINAKPSIMLELSNHIENGIFDKIQQEIVSVQSKNKNAYQGMNALEIYGLVGSHLNKIGAFDSPEKTQQAEQKAEQEKASRKSASKTPSLKTSELKGIEADKNALYNMNEDDFANYMNNLLK